MIKKLIAGCMALLCLVSGAIANTGGPAWDKFPAERMSDKGALQNGAKLFVNYCLNCHAASYMRYNRLTDLGLTEAQIKQNLLFATEKVGDTMKFDISQCCRTSYSQGRREYMFRQTGNTRRCMRRIRHLQLEHEHRCK